MIEGIRARWTAHRRPLLAAGAGLAAAMSVLWFRVLPDAVDGATGWAWLALRLGHGVCWALLAASMVVGVANGPRRLRAGLAWGALASYAAFVLALVTL
ncbi:MAG TPA: hypothetical protein VLA55_12115 [Ornithinibacter sp.]|nr:hypothetical protein [Ornithinibacter sp.]